MHWEAQLLETPSSGSWQETSESEGASRGSVSSGGETDVHVYDLTYSPEQGKQEVSSHQSSLMKEQDEVSILPPEVTTQSSDLLDKCPDEIAASISNKFADRFCDFIRGEGRLLTEFELIALEKFIEARKASQGTIPPCLSETTGDFEERISSFIHNNEETCLTSREYDIIKNLVRSTQSWYYHNSNNDNVRKPLNGPAASADMSYGSLLDEEQSNRGSIMNDEQNSQENHRKKRSLDYNENFSNAFSSMKRAKKQDVVTDELKDTKLMEGGGGETHKQQDIGCG